MSKLSFDQVVSAQSNAIHGYQWAFTIHCNGIVPFLNSLIPSTALRRLVQRPSSLMSTFHGLQSAYFKLLIFLAANNFAGLDDKGAEKILRTLQTKSHEQLCLLFRSIQGPTSKAVAEGIFHHAIKVGSTEIVDFILQNPFIDIDANRETCSIQGSVYTPIELSSECQQVAVTRVLLHHGADVNRNFKDPSGNECGILFHAIPSSSDSIHHVNFELVQTLLAADAKVHYHTVDRLIGRIDENLLELIMRCRPDDYLWWNIRGVFHRCVETLEEEASTRIVSLMIDTHLDLNRHVYRPRDDRSPLTSEYSRIGRNLFDFHKFRPHPDPRTILDVAARRGSLYLVRTLLQSGACPTDHTLVHAMTSMNLDLAHFLLNHGPSVRCGITLAPTTIFVAAMYTQDTQLLRSVVQRGALRQIKLGDDFNIAAMAAASVGNIEICRALLTIAKNSDFLLPDGLGFAVEAALEGGQEDLALFLIQGGANVDISVLELALDKVMLPVVRAILDSGVRLEIYKSKKLLSKATLLGNYSVIEELISRGFDVNECDRDKFPLLIAVERQDLGLVKLLLRAGAKISQGIFPKNDRQLPYRDDRAPRTALAAAVTNNDLTMVKFLFENGADPNDSLALSEAVFKNDQMVHLLLQRFSRSYPLGKKRYGSLALIAAIEKGALSMIGAITERADVTHYSNSYGKYRMISPLDYAILKDRTREARLLLERGANDNPAFSTWSIYRENALSVAITARNISMVRLLFEFRVDVNSTVSNRTPLQMAAAMGNFELVQLLLDNGADVNLPPTKFTGATALQLAATRGYVGIAALLLEKGADVNARPYKRYGKMALECAAEWGRLDMVQLLVEAGADLRHPNYGRYRRAMKLAREKGHFGTFELLQSYDPYPEPSAKAVFTDKGGWTFWGVETEDGFEPWEGEVPAAQDQQQLIPEENFRAQCASASGA